jgi:hypothetical protein
MEKKVSEMTHDELYKTFKDATIELFQGIFRGDKHDEMPLQLFLGGDTPRFTQWANANKDKIQMAMMNKDENGDFIPKEESISLVPIPVEIVLGPAHEIANMVPPFMADTIIAKAKEACVHMTKLMLQDVNNAVPGALQFYAMVAESFVVESKDPEVLKKIQEGVKPSEIDGAKECMTFMFESKNRCDLVVFDIVRSYPDELEYQVLTNRKDHDNVTSGGGIFEGIIYQPKAKEDAK